MRRAPLLLVTGGAFLLMHASAGAVPVQAPERRGEDGLRLLERAARAARDLDYRGTQMVSSWSTTGSSSALIDVAHVGGEGLLLRVAPTPQNPGGAVYDDEAGEVPQVVGFRDATLALIAAHYDVAVTGRGAVAGRQAYVVAVSKPGAPASARYWLDTKTSLPLRREVLDEAGRTVRESAFLELSIGPARVAETVLEAAWRTPAAPGAPADAAVLRAEGWHAPERLASGLELIDARLSGETLHLTYSDGLATVSVFQQRGELDTGAVEGWRAEDVGDDRVWVQDAFPRRVVWGGAGTVFTVVADCPQRALDDLVGTLPHGNPGPGIGSRLGNGLTRVGSWLNPFA